MKCFEQMILVYIRDCIPVDLDSHQFAYEANRSTEDAVSITLHTALSHLYPNTYVKMLFVDFSSAFNTIIPHEPVLKLIHLGLPTSLCSWTFLDFLSNRLQNVRVGDLTYSTNTLNTSAPQGCVLSPALYTLFTNDCIPIPSSNTIIKFAEDTTGVGLISDNNEWHYRQEVVGSE